MSDMHESEHAEHAHAQPGPEPGTPLRRGTVDAPEPRDPDDMRDEEIRNRIVRLAFGGDRARYDAFARAVREATPPDVTIVLRGSAVTGQRWADGQPFDADGPGTSDIDLTFVGGDALKLWNEFYIPGLHSVPLSEDHPDASPTFLPLRRALCALAGRPVNIQATSDFVQFGRDILLDQPFFTLIDKDEREAERARWEAELESKRRASRDAGREDEGRGPPPDAERAPRPAPHAPA
jgi:hypothetical protein